jgi:2'-5' RNA ligase
MRAFLAAEIPPGVHDWIAAAVRELRGAGARARWIQPDSIHLTIRFLGESPAALVDRQRGGLHEFGASQSPIDWRMGTVGAFPQRGAARVLWIGVHPVIADRLAVFALALESIVSSLGWPSGKRPLSPHLTLARLKPGEAAAARRALEAAAGRMDAGGAPGFTMNHLVLFESILGGGSARYRKIDSFPLSGAAA